MISCCSLVLVQYTVYGIGGLTVREKCYYWCDCRFSSLEHHRERFEILNHSYRVSSADQEVPYTPLFRQTDPIPFSCISQLGLLLYFSRKDSPASGKRFVFRIAIKILRHGNRIQVLVASDLVPDRLYEVVAVRRACREEVFVCLGACQRIGCVFRADDPVEKLSKPFLFV